jgi:hemerythrin-like domain-containing protein
MNGPADTRMMGIVHTALRRDLGRLHDALTDGRPSPEQRAALGEHVAWMMEFLHAHHAGEDDGLYPMVLAKNPQARELLAVMDADHERVIPAMDAFGQAAAHWTSSGSEADRVEMLNSLDRLTAVLYPHLEREENEMMPVVAASITHGDWHRWDQQHNIKPKSLPKLAEEGNWLIDDLDPDRRKIVEAEVPAVPRYIVLYGFGPGYRKRSRARWGVS